MQTNYTEIGLKVGLEIHQQLATSTKLFCGCKLELFKGEPDFVFLRRLRPTQSELGQVDPAAFFEFQKGVKVKYEATRDTSCLVEMDEEPPHPLNMEAVEIVLTTALMMHAKPVDEIHVMRKTVIDGSNTTGFQRTCIIASDGWLKVGDRRISIQATSLEEDAARKTGTESEGKIICYRIDRLGIPLIEVTTGPEMHSPEEAQEVASAIGRTLRDTGKVVRGLGTIRQDLNISIPSGALVEIKGVQELELISKVVAYEVQRQLKLIEISGELKNRGIEQIDLNHEIVDVTNVFRNTKCKVISKALSSNKIVAAAKLPKFNGLLKQELMPDFRFGTELSDRAKFWGRVGGIFHTDELPNYGITAEEVEILRKTLSSAEDDAIVFVADTEENVTDALRAVVERAQEAITCVPAETRTVKEDGTTRYMRPRPGAARMYPETDIPPSPITKEFISQIRSRLPEPSQKKRARFMKDYSLNEKLTKQVIDSEYSPLFEIAVKESGVAATTIAAFLTETIKALKREGIQAEKVSDSQLMEIFRAVGSGQLAKEAIPDVFTWLSKNEGENLQKALESLGLRMMSREQLTNLVDRAIEENRPSVEKQGGKAFGLLMGLIMKEARGRADPKLVGALLKEKLA